MTEVAFHFNVPDRVGYACRLLRKAAMQGAKVAVKAERDLLGRLDQALWTFAPNEFVSHCRTSADEVMLMASSVVLLEGDAASPYHQVLLNLSAEVPEDFGRYERLIELVTLDEEDRMNARRRWKHYADRGYAITRHDLARQDGA